MIISSNLVFENGSVWNPRRIGETRVSKEAGAEIEVRVVLTQSGEMGKGEKGIQLMTLLIIEAEGSRRAAWNGSPIRDVICCMRDYRLSICMPILGVKQEQDRQK